MRTNAKAGTQERAQAAQKAAALAATVAWAAFEAGHYEEAATWFARQAALKKDSYESARSYYEAQFAANNAKFQAMVDATPDESRKTSLRSIAASAQSMSLTALFMLALENNDVETRLKVAGQKLTMRRAELANLKRTGADAAKVNAKQAEIADSIEEVAGARTDQAQYEDAKKNYDEALALRRALATDFPQRNLQEPLSGLGRMSALMGDYTQARDYFQQALAAEAASAQLRQAAVQAETSAELQALMRANMVMGQVKTLNNLAGVMSESGDYKAALSYYDQALKALEVLPQDGVVGTFRASMRALVLANTAVVHADSGEVERSLGEFNDVIKMQRGLGEDANAAIALVSVGGLYAEKGDLSRSKSYIEQARQIFIATQDLRNVVSTTFRLSRWRSRRSSCRKRSGMAWKPWHWRARSATSVWSAKPPAPGRRLS